MQQITGSIMMVRPSNFGFNTETANNNAFQSNDEHDSVDNIKKKAIEEFDRFVSVLTEFGVEVTVIEDTVDPVKTDAVFPNNWVTFHGSGAVITYPMYSKNRRLERRDDVIKSLSEKFGFNKWMQFEKFEEDKQYLEGTGSMILDRTNKIIYACRSERTDDELLQLFADHFDYKAILFDAFDKNGIAIYHTNVMMALGVDFCVICLESIPLGQRDLIFKHLNETKKEIIEITHKQMNHFAGNMVQVKNVLGETALVMSSQAFESLTEGQVHKIKAKTTILYSPLYTIEKYGGGSARCMIAEVFKP